MVGIPYTNNDYSYVVDYHSIEKRKDDELTRKVLEDMKQEEQMYHRDRNDNIPTFDDWDR